MLLGLTVNGFAMGMTYALLAVGMLLIVRAVKIINMAQGDILTSGAYITYLLTTTAGLNTPTMLVSAILIFAGIGIIFMFTCIWPMRNRPNMMNTMVCTIGASMVISQLCLLIGGTESKMMDPIIPGSFTIFNAAIRYQYVIIIGASALMLLLVYLFFDKMYCGKIMEAAVQDKYAATLIGIPTALTTLLVFIIVGVVTGLNGWLVAPTFIVSTTLSNMQMRAFAGVVIGGMGSVKGSVIGCLIIGLLEAYSTLFTTTYKDLVVFSLLILVLIIRPQGFFGEKTTEKA